MAQPGSALHWGCRGRGFKSRRSDHKVVQVGTDKPKMVDQNFRYTQVFSNTGHALSHLFMMIYPTVVLALETEFSAPYHVLISLISVGNFISLGFLCAKKTKNPEFQAPIPPENPENRVKN